MGLKEPQLQCHLGEVCGRLLATSLLLGLAECSGVVSASHKVMEPPSSSPITSDWASHLLSLGGVYC